MSDEMAQKLVQGGIKAVKNGETELARKAFTQALKLDPNNEAAWLGMATITEAAKDKIRILKKVLEINPANQQAQTVLQRLEAEAEAPAPSSPFSAAIEDKASFEEVSDLDEIPLPPLPSTEVAETVSSPEIAPIVETPSPEPYKFKSLAEAFAEAPQPPSRGTGGIPLVDNQKIKAISENVSGEIQTYLEDMLADYLRPDVNWKKKRRGRAGESEYAVFLGQIAFGFIIFLVIVGLGLAVYINNNPEAQKYLFAPTWTPSSTFTVTPTITPGATNTPSPTPSGEPSITPTLPITITPGNPDPFFPPTATAHYYPVPVTTGLIEAVNLMMAGDLEAAFPLLQTEINAVELSGDFPPTYRLSQWYLLNGDPEEARNVLLTWEETWQARDPSLYENSFSLLLIAYARVDIYEAVNGLGDTTTLLNNAEQRLGTVLGVENPANAIDRLNADAYILLAQVYELRGEIDDAISLLTQGTNVSFQGESLLTNTSLYYEKARILGAAGRTSEALQALESLLTIDPFNESALLLQIEIALEAGQNGLAVLFAQEYLLYYPGSVHGYYLLGQAREAENKLDLALTAYSQAVAGDPEDENYTSDPFYLEALLRRADLYVQQGRIDLAADDYQLALRVSDDDELIRVRSLEANFASGNYEIVLENAAELIENSDSPQAAVLFYQGRAYIELASEENEENYELGLEALENALNSGLSSRDITEAQDYIARANFALGNSSEALEAINIAIEAEDTASRRFLRAQILQAQATRTGSNNDFEAALLDYEYVLTWGQIFPYPFLESAQTAYDEIITRLGER